MKKKNKWIKRRHKRFMNCFAKPFVAPFLVPKYLNIPKPVDIKGPGLIIHNHQTASDQFLIQKMFKQNLYFIATEDIFSNGFVSKLLKRYLAPISKMKSFPDVVSVKNSLQVMREGGLVCVCPEGNRTYSGSLCYVDPAIVKLVKKSHAPLIICNIVGGYAYQPRWTDKKRKTSDCKVCINTIIQPEEIEKMSEQELYEKILEKFDVSSQETNLHSYSKRRAEYMERVFYICPECGAISSIESNGNKVKCKHCDLEFDYNENLQLIPNRPCKVNSIKEWYNYQDDWMLSRSMEDLSDYIFQDDEVKLIQVIPNKRKVKIAVGHVQMNNNDISFNSKKIKKVFLLENLVAATCAGRNKLNFYTKNGEIFQLKGQPRFNALKYMHLFYQVQHLKGGVSNDKLNGRFLGI